MKNFSDIQALLDRYWEGETTLEEERALKAYFASGRVDERLHAVAPFFQALREEQVVQYAKAKVAPLRPIHFSWQKMAAAASVALLFATGLWWWSQRGKPVLEQVAQQNPIQQEQPVLQEKPVEQSIVQQENFVHSEISETPKLIKKILPKHTKSNAITPDPETEKAMEEIKAALALVSSKMNKGKREAAKNTIHLENVDRIFKKKSEG